MRSADIEAVIRSLKVFQEKFWKYYPRNVWAADEFGLLHRHPPGRTLLKSTTLGQKRITQEFQF